MRGIEAVPHIDKWRKFQSILNSILNGALEKAIIGIALARGYVNRKMNGYKEIV